MLIDGCDDVMAIAELFNKRFSSISGAYDDSSQNHSTRDIHRTYGIFLVTADTRENGRKSLKCGLGYDGTRTNLLKFLNSRNNGYLLKFLNMLYVTMCIRERYLTKTMIQVIIRLITEDTFGHLSSSEIYREIVISSYLFQLME